MLPACVAGGLPPSVTDVGSTVQAPTGELRTGLRFSSGAQWASATTRADQDFDVGIGYVYERIEGEAGDIRDQSSGDYELDGVRSSQGAYLSFSGVLARNPVEHHRTWLGVRAEFLHASEADGGPSLNLLARGSWEIFGPAVGAGGTSDACGLAVGAAYGTIGLGVYLEAGARRSLEGEAAFVSTAGVSLRLPALWGMGAGWCSN